MGADPVESKDQAIQVLLACRELFTDEELQGNLADIDTQCGGVMAEWQPPWIHEGIQQMDFDEEKLLEMPVKDWVEALAAVLQELLVAAEEAQLLHDEPAFLVVMPHALPVLPTLARLGGGLAHLGSRTCTAALPFSRLIFLQALQERSARSSCGTGHPWNGFVKDAKSVPSSDEHAQHPEETVRSSINGGPIQQGDLGIDSDKRTQDESSVPELMGPGPVKRSERDAFAANRLKSTCLPSTIKFIHLNVLEAGNSEAVGLILGVMQLLREEEIWAKLMALDAYCDNLLSNWQPPWVEDQPPTANLEISLQRLQEEDESIVYDWAMALDGFCSFVANLAVAARVHHQVTSEPSSGEATAEVEIPKSHATIALVVVVPNNLCEWHLEVLGPLLRAFKIFMLTEKAWRADFNAASSVPFSVEAAAMAHGKPT